jgi:anaerobic selenocysteine-containing dehydrogenase
LPDRLRTSDKYIDLAPEILVKDVERVREWERTRLNSSLNGELLLIGRRQLRTNNSWMHNSERLVKGNPAKPACSILMHPEDAARRGLASGQNVLVRSRVGEITLPLEVSDEIMPGVVSIPHGWGHDRSGNHLAVAQQHPGASINDLTDHLTIDTLCGTAAFNGTPVTVLANPGSVLI